MTDGASLLPVKTSEEDDPPAVEKGSEQSFRVTKTEQTTTKTRAGTAPPAATTPTSALTRHSWWY